MRILIFWLLTPPLFGQLVWNEVTTEYGILPQSIKVFKSEPVFRDSAFIAYYVSVDTKDKKLELSMDTTRFRRITPSQYYERLGQPYIVVNTTFFEFQKNTSVSVVSKKGEILAYNSHSIQKDDRFVHVLAGTIGQEKSGQMNVTYTFADPSFKKVYYQEVPMIPLEDSFNEMKFKPGLKKWKTKWAVGGGPVLIRDSEINITNNEELKFAGKAILDRHPRTAMGYTKDGKLIILAIQGRMKNAIGATLTEMAEILLELGCVEALNLDGGGSSCLLVNGKETIVPSDKTGQRPIPAVFFVK